MACRTSEVFEDVSHLNRQK